MAWKHLTFGSMVEIEISLFKKQHHLTHTDSYLSNLPYLALYTIKPADMGAQRKYNKLEDKHILIIGGSSGIGYGVAEASLESGAIVTISSSQQAKVDAAVAGLEGDYPGAKVSGLAANLGDPATVEDALDGLFKQATSASGPVNHIVFTAADALALGSLEQTSVDIVYKAAQMRLVAPLITGKVAARYLDKSAKSSITITTGVAAEKPGKGWAAVAYFAGGLQGLTKALATDLGPIRVNCVRPGYVKTALWDGMGEEAKKAFFKEAGGKMPVGRVGEVEDVVEAFLWCMKDANVTGTIAGTDSGAMLV